jgi:hypothetical protein
MNRVVQRATAALTLGTVAGALLPSQAVFADLTGFDWSATGGQLQIGVSQNVVGFWQTLGHGMSTCSGTFYYDGIYGTQTRDLTKIMKRDLLNAPNPDGIVYTGTWGKIQDALDDLGSLRLQRSSGNPGQNGFFTYYNGQPEAAQLYWQGNNTGSHIWKFKPPSASDYLQATTAHTMPSIARPCPG